MGEAAAWGSLAAAFACAAVIVLDELRQPQKMWIMNIVWPVTALYLSVFGLAFYWSKGRSMTKSATAGMGHGKGGEPDAPTWRQAAVAASHCGAGCALADIGAEFGLFALGWTLAGSELWASYAGDLVLAWLLGIVFQYFTIKPMRQLSMGGGITAAIKADTLSIVAFQIGMYGWMAVAYFVLFPAPHLHPDQAMYWAMMQAGMVCGFLTTLPMNRLLLRTGWKERMG